MAPTIGDFFLRWLPERFNSLDRAKPALAAADLSVQVIVGDERYFLRTDGEGIAATAGDAVSEPTFTLLTSADTYEALIAPAALELTPSTPMLKLLDLDSESIALVKGVPGSLQLTINDGEKQYFLRLVPGRYVEGSPAGCIVGCSLADLLEVQEGKLQPLELLMNGKLTLEGDIQIAMALGGLLM